MLGLGLFGFEIIIFVTNELMCYQVGSDRQRVLLVLVRYLYLGLGLIRLSQLTLEKVLIVQLVYQVLGYVIVQMKRVLV